MDEGIKLIINMGKEINLLVNYPKSKRNLVERVKEKTEEVRAIARRFGKEFFDGSMIIQVGGDQFFISQKIAENLYVQTN